MSYTVHMMSSEGDLPRRPAATIREAQDLVTKHLMAGWRGLTAEVIDQDGEVAAYFDRGWTIEQL
jgi:hypothetical protein